MSSVFPVSYTHLSLQSLNQILPVKAVHPYGSVKAHCSRGGQSIQDVVLHAIIRLCVRILGQDIVSIVVGPRCV